MKSLECKATPYLTGQTNSAHARTARYTQFAKSVAVGRQPRMGQNLCRATAEKHASPIRGVICLFLGPFSNSRQGPMMPLPRELEYRSCLITTNVALLAEPPRLPRVHVRCSARLRTSPIVEHGARTGKAPFASFLASQIMFDRSHHFTDCFNKCVRYGSNCFLRDTMSLSSKIPTSRRGYLIPAINSSSPTITSSEHLLFTSVTSKAEN